jgi:hypothetical protein
MVKLLKYKIYCVTDKRFEEVWLPESASPPTKCPVNSNHEINPDSIFVDGGTEELSVEIKEESIQTGGHFRTQDFCFKCKPNDTTKYRFSFPIEISVLSFKLSVTSNMSGDKFSGIISPNTVVGLLTQDIDITNDSHKTFTVSSSVISNVFKGMIIDLFNSSDNTTSDCGQIIDIDSNNNKITVENLPNVNYPTGSYVRVGVAVAYNLTVPQRSNDFFLEVGTTKIGASYLKKNTETEVTYINNSDTEKICHVFYEYLY